MHIYKAKVLSVYDGDTFRAEVDLGFNIKTVMSFRLAGINAPEIKGDERKDGLDSYRALKSAILNKEVVIHTSLGDSGRSDHWLAIVWLGNGDTINVDITGSATNVNESMIEQGFAKSTKS